VSDRELKRVRTIAIVGCGSLGAIIARGIRDGAAGPYRTIAVYNGADGKRAESLAAEVGAVAYRTLDSLLAIGPDYVVEAANIQALRELVVPALAAGSHVIALSIGAFADPSFHALATCAAQENGKTVYLASGAIGGLDVTQSAAIAGELRAFMLTEKPPRGLVGAPGFRGEMSLSEPTEIFAGTAIDAIEAFPKNVNVVATLALAAGGFSHVTTRIVSNPKLSHNRHTIELAGRFGIARIEIESAASPENAKSSTLAAYSVLAKLKALASPIQI